MAASSPCTHLGPTTHAQLLSPVLLMCAWGAVFTDVGHSVEGQGAAARKE